MVSFPFHFKVFNKNGLWIFKNLVWILFDNTLFENFAFVFGRKFFMCYCYQVLKWKLYRIHKMNLKSSLYFSVTWISWINIALFWKLNMQWTWFLVNSSMNFNKYNSCNYNYYQDTNQVYHPKKLPCPSY